MFWSIVHLIAWILAIGLTFGVLARWFACNPDQPRFVTREMADDALYWLVSVFCYADLATLLIKGGVGVALQSRAPAAVAAILAGYGWAARLPLLLQAFLVIVLIDIIQYWLHRAFHSRALWPFHAIHHSAEEVGWTTTYRIHPVNFLVYSAGALALVRLVGFSPAVFVLLAPFNLVMGSLVHANLNWTYGPFRYVLASPVYHRWHHSKDPAVRDKNFAPTFPVLDLMFGTYYMPKDRLPEIYGVDGVPEHFLGQLIYPFAITLERLGLTKPKLDQAAA
ncbi:MAG: sterol desaturase family protein [Caulobacterales bacterium]